MNKQVVAAAVESQVEPSAWLDLASLARVRLTSEDDAHPIESAFREHGGAGWQAAHAGSQTIWLSFDAPQAIREVYLRFEVAEERTQEFLLQWSNDGGVSYHEIVRQQFNFSPRSAPTEIETYSVGRSDVTDLKLVITPDISGGTARATLRAFRVR